MAHGPQSQCTSARCESASAPSSCWQARFYFLAIDNESFLSDHSFAMKHAHFGLAMLLLVAAALAWMIPGGQTSEVSENFGGASAIMVLPIMIALSRDVLRAVPRALREASLALGATKAETIWSVILPYARVGITGAVLLSLGRALGESGRRRHCNSKSCEYQLWSESSRTPEPREVGG